MVPSHESSNRNHALLLQPPASDLTGPYPALPYLKSYAAPKGFKICIRDLGIEALDFLTRDHKIVELGNRAADLRREMETRGSLSGSEQRHFLLASMAMGIGLEPALLRKELDRLKDPQCFYDYKLYKRACAFLDAFFRLLSAVYFPTIVSPSEYPTVTALKTMANVLAHRHRGVNPYIGFYEEILLPQTASLAPKVIGISMVYASQSVQALVLGSLLKERFPAVHVTMGGAYLSQWALNMEESQMAELFNCTDSIICGEGEQPFSMLLERIDKDVSLAELPNVIYKDPNSGDVKRFKELVYTDITTQPPPDFSDLRLDAYLIPETIIPYCISRGCYWGRCVFCQNRYGDRQMRQYQTIPVDKAIAEMSQLSAEHRTRHFNFSNDVIDPLYLKKFSRAVLDAGKHFIWNTDLRAEKAFTIENAQLLKRAGLNSVAIGFESGCQKVLNAMDKGKEIENVREVFGNLYNAGIATQAMGIFGFPGETEADGWASVRFIEENIDRISYYVMGLLMVLPGSKMHANPAQYGIDEITYAHTPMKTPEPVWRSKNRMPVAAVNRLYDRLNRLENIYVIDEYPYVGSLSTNHSFHYFTLGPDILKRLKTDENRDHLKCYEILNIGGHRQQPRAIKSVFPRKCLPYVVYQSPFAFEHIGSDSGGFTDRAPLFSGAFRTYLIDPVNLPVPVGPLEMKILNRIDGRRNLKSVLKKVAENSPKNAMFFLLYLASSGFVKFRS